MLYNKWKGEMVAWETPGPFPWSGVEGFTGIVPIPVILDPKIGTEVTLHIFDYSPFSHEIAELEPFNLFLKTGLARCPSGPVYFNFYWLENPRKPEESFAIYERQENPNDPEMIQPYWDLARQSHWHVFVIGPNDECLNWFEIKNGYGIDSGLDVLSEAVSGMPTKDFAKAKEEFQKMYSLQDLLNIDVGNQL